MFSNFLFCPSKSCNSHPRTCLFRRFRSGLFFTVYPICHSLLALTVYVRQSFEGKNILHLRIRMIFYRKLLVQIFSLFSLY